MIRILSKKQWNKGFSKIETAPIYISLVNYYPFSLHSLYRATIQMVYRVVCDQSKKKLIIFFIIHKIGSVCMFNVISYYTFTFPFQILKSKQNSFVAKPVLPAREPTKTFVSTVLIHFGSDLIESLKWKFGKLGFAIELHVQ